jgi:radical SAM protein with 4Fe4S-binding SPASM domain
MAGTGMKKIRLKPYVYNVKGAKNHAFYDLLNEKLYQVSPEGELETFKKQLLESGLAVETSGIVPKYFFNEAYSYTKKLHLRQLQLRINSECGCDCEDCNNLCGCFKGGVNSLAAGIEKVLAQFNNFTIDNVMVTGGDPTRDTVILEKIKENIPALRYTIKFKGPVSEALENNLQKMRYILIAPFDVTQPKQEAHMKVDNLTFFYTQKFNSCWGNTVAIDVDGAIKPCLWSDEILGNIFSDNIKNIIVSGAFNKYWEMPVEKIETCGRCEYRNGCRDCRVLAKRKAGSYTVKHPACSYNPETGKW